MTIDLWPTIARLAGARPPAEPIDGLDIWPLLSGVRGAKSPHEALYFYWDAGLHAVRSGSWKLHFAHDYVHPDPVGGGGQPGKVLTFKTSLALYNLEADVSEKRDLSAEHPEIVARLQALAEKARVELGDSLNQRTGRGVREPGKVGS
jgi:arylsulfatase A